MGGKRWALTEDMLPQEFKDALVEPSIKDIIESNKQSNQQVSLRCSKCNNVFTSRLRSLVTSGGELLCSGILCKSCAVSNSMRSWNLQEGAIPEELKQSLITPISYIINSSNQSNLSVQIKCTNCGEPYTRSLQWVISKDGKLIDSLLCPHCSRSSSIKKLWRNQDYKNKQVETQKIVQNKESVNLKRSESIKAACSTLDTQLKKSKAKQSWWNDHPQDRHNLANYNKEHPECLKASPRSLGEISIEEYIQSMGLLTEHNRSPLNGSEVDILIPDKGIGIEYNGDYWHSDRLEYFKDTRFTRRLTHYDKFKQCKDKGIHLIQIRESDWCNPYQQEKIKHYLHDLLSADKSVHYARKLTLKSVEPLVAQDFYQQYHLQGCNLKFQYTFGLYNNDELISCMSFGKSRVRGKSNPEGYYELHRYCVKSGCTVLGGAEKLFKHFIRTYDPIEIKSFSDNDYFSGGIYIRLGFKEVDQSRVYYWWKGNENLPRESCQLSKLKEKFPDTYLEAKQLKEGKQVSNLEVYIMEKEGYMKYTTAGRTKWIWRNNEYPTVLQEKVPTVQDPT